MTSSPVFGPAGTALWESLTSAYVFAPAEVALLSAACRQCDDIAALEDVLERDGLVVPGSSGQPRLSAVVSELRQSRLALAKLLGALAVPDDEDDRPMSEASRRAQRAARVRWDRQRRARERIHGDT